jgi:hypothetical protein
MDAAMGAAQEVANAYSEDRININNADHRETVMNSVNYVENNPTLDKQTLKGLGILDQLEIDGNMDEQAIPRHVWRTAFLQNQIEESRLAKADKIGDNQQGRAWLAAAQEQDDKILSASIASTAQDAYQYRVNEMVNRRKAAALKKDWVGVEEAQSSQIYNDIYAQQPGLREIHKLEVEQGKENAILDDMMLHQRFDDVMDYARKGESSLGGEELRKRYFAAQTAQIKQEDELEALDKERRENNYITTLQGLSRGELTLDDVNRNPLQDFTPSHYNILVNYAQAQPGRLTAVSAGLVDAKEAEFALNISQAKYGVYPDAVSDIDGDGVVTLKDFKSYMRTAVPRNITTVDENGVIVPGFDAETLTKLLNDVEKVEEVPYETGKYKRLNKELNLRILRKDDSGDPWLATPESTELMADALDSLDAFIQMEGPAADLAKWEAEQMPLFFNDAAKAALFNMDEALVPHVVFSQEGRFSVDHGKTLESLQRAVTQALANAGGNASAAEVRAAQQRADDFDSYWKAWGQYAGDK